MLLFENFHGGRDKNLAQNLSCKNLKGRGHLEDLGEDGSTILK
jgi:hypothetical protein